MDGKIFVSYRRDDAAMDARALYGRLADTFGSTDIFMDVDQLALGQRFDHQLARALEKSEVFLAIIGPRWLEALNERAASSGPDYVREEIAEALRRGILLIPILVGRARMPRPDELPEDIRALALHQKHEVSGERFGADTAELINAITAQRKAARSWAPLRSSRMNVAMVAVVFIGVALLAFVQLWKLPGILQFLSTVNSNEEMGQAIIVVAILLTAFAVAIYLLVRFRRAIQIFVNYRRGLDAGYARALYQELEKSFSARHLFMDVEGLISAGDDYVDALNERVASCDAMLVVIGPHWIMAADEQGKKRLDNPEDWVRLEIVSALDYRKRVIPVLVDNAQPPLAADLPEPMRPLARRQAVRLTHERFSSDIKGLVDQLRNAR